MIVRFLAITTSIELLSQCGYADPTASPDADDDLSLLQVRDPALQVARPQVSMEVTGRGQALSQVGHEHDETDELSLFGGIAEVQKKAVASLPSAAPTHPMHSPVVSGAAANQPPADGTNAQGSAQPFFQEGAMPEALASMAPNSSMVPQTAANTRVSFAIGAASNASFAASATSVGMSAGVATAGAEGPQAHVAEAPSPDSGKSAIPAMPPASEDAHEGVNAAPRPLVQVESLSPLMALLTHSPADAATAAARSAANYLPAYQLGGTTLLDRFGADAWTVRQVTGLILAAIIVQSFLVRSWMDSSVKVRQKEPARAMAPAHEAG